MIIGLQSVNNSRFTNRLSRTRIELRVALINKDLTVSQSDNNHTSNYTLLFRQTDSVFEMKNSNKSSFLLVVGLQDRYIPVHVVVPFM